MGPPPPFSPLTKAVLVTLVVVPLGVVVVRSDDVADRPVPITSARAAGDDRITVASVCLPPERLDVDVREGLQVVTVTVTALDFDPDETDGCESHSQVVLASPLADRRLVDGATGDEVPVEDS